MITIRTPSTRARFSRRALLRQMGVGAALLPMLHAERALGNTAGGPPRRLITIAWTNGVAQSLFYPQGDDPTSTPVLKPLAPFKSKVIGPVGLDIKVMLDRGKKYDGHFSYPTLFTGTYRNTGGQRCTATGPSLDQVVSNEIAKTATLPVPLMNVAASGRSTSYRGDNQQNTAEGDVVRMFNRLFTGRNLPTEQVDLLRNRRKSVLDYLGKELESWNMRLGKEDREKVGAHLQSVRDLESQLAASAAAPAKTCATPAAPAATTAYPTKVKLFNDMAALAIRCDVTRVVTMVWGDDGGSGPSSFQFMGVGGDYHGIAHRGPGGYDQKVKIDTWLFEQVAYLAKLLDETQESGGTALDNSVIVTANDMNEGNGHYVGAIPFVLIGRAGGFLKTGRVVKVGNWAGKTGTYWRGDVGVAHNRLLATLGQAMGLNVDGFGESNYRGVLSELRG
jgi:hypothetical protein